MKQELTSKEKQLLSYLNHYFEKHESSPTFSEIQTHFGFASLSSVYRYLQVLKNKGFIQISRSSKNKIVLNSTKKKQITCMHYFPLIGHLTDEGEIEHAPTIKKIPYGSNRKFSSGCFLLEVATGNYLEAGLLHHDLIIVEPRSEAISKEAVLAKLYDEQFAIKKYQPMGAYTRLDSFCIQVEPMLVLNEEVSIHGVVLGVIRSYSLS